MRVQAFDFFIEADSLHQERRGQLGDKGET